MQVTDVADRVTHAVIGGKASSAFEIASTPEFYAILSDALYKDKPLAVVREILCNAWDSHIEAGCTDKPVEVTITSDRMTIRDHGKGIPPEMIVPIYGTYGGSTKKENGAVTGGFGLGSKAPFAYADHFEVTSHHNGKKDIYKMSKSSATVGGLPSIAPIINGLPTDETGIAVSLNVKNYQDADRFQDLVRQIASFGEMNVLLNGGLIKKIPFSKSVNGFLLMQRHHLHRTAAAESMVAIRYGHVVYPLEQGDHFSDQFDRIKSFLKTVFGGDYSYNYGSGSYTVVLQAPADSISVTPSRESLSMTDHTIETVDRLLSQFLDYTEGKLEKVCTEFTMDSIEKTWLIGSPQELLNREIRIPNFSKVPKLNTDYIADFDTLGRVYLSSTYPKMRGFRQKDIEARVNTLISNGFGRRGLLASYRAALRKEGLGLASDWFHRNLLRPIVKGMIGHKTLSHERLYVWTDVEKVGKYGYSKGAELGFALATKMRKRPLEEYLPFLRGIVILAFNRLDLDRTYQFPVVKHWLGEARESLLYTVPRNTERAKEARKYFEDLGLTVLDLTIKQPWEAPEVVLPQSKGPSAKPRKKGLIQLDYAIAPSSGNIRTERLFQTEDATRILNPEFIIRPRTKQGSSFGGYGTIQCEAIIRLYGSKGGVVHNTTQEENFKMKGVPTFEEYLVQQLSDEFHNNPLIREMYEQDPTHVDANTNIDYRAVEFYTMVRRDPQLCTHFKLKPFPGKHELDVKLLWENYSHWQTQHDPELKKVSDLIKSWVRAPEVVSLVNTISNGKLTKIIHTGNVTTLFTVGDATVKQSIRDILLLALKG